jgi:hypothetical protein
VRKAVLVIAIALMGLATLTANINIVLSETTYTEPDHAGGNCIIDVPGYTMIRLLFTGHATSDYYDGKADRIQVNVHTGQFTPAGLPVFKAVSAYEDNPTRNLFSIGLVTGQVQNLVEPGQIQILRVGKNNTIMVHWNIPLFAPATGGANPTPEVTVPPGMLLLQGYGEALSGSTALTAIGNTGWKYSTESTYYSAKATFFCEEWNYKWLPVAEQYAGTSMVPRALTDRVTIWWHP